MIIFANTENFIFKNCAAGPVFLWLHHLVLFLWLRGISVGWGGSNPVSSSSDLYWSLWDEIPRLLPVPCQQQWGETRSRKHVWISLCLRCSCWFAAIGEDSSACWLWPAVPQAVLSSDQHFSQDNKVHNWYVDTGDFGNCSEVKQCINGKSVKSSCCSILCVIVTTGSVISDPVAVP